MDDKSLPSWNKIVIWMAWSPYPDNYREFRWWIDDLRIYNRALSESEIKAVYASTLKN